MSKTVVSVNNGRALRSVAVILLVAAFSAHLTSAALTEHFQNWLDDNGYAEYNFYRGGLSFGGKENDSDTVVNQPAVFIHGDTGSAYDWNASMIYFMSQGYKMSELYATTWGKPTHGGIVSELQYHSEKFVMKNRKFVEAVLNYTGAEKIDVLGHSMGVTMSRKVVQGGLSPDNGTDFEVGPPLLPYVDTYVGIAGLNRGSNGCASSTTSGCNDENGMYPGIMMGTTITARSQYLEGLDFNQGYEGDYIYVIWSRFDEAIGNGDMVYCQPTSRIIGQLDEMVYNSSEYTHNGMRDLSAPLQLSLVKYHTMLDE